MLKITLIKSFIGRPEKQRKVSRGLGLKRLHHYVIRQDCPEIRGMIAKIPHMLKVEKISSGKEAKPNNA